MKNFAKKFYFSKKWQECRKAFIADRRMIDGGLCQHCRAAPGYIVHHKVHLTPENIGDADIALSFDNLEFVCHDCHNKEHFGRYGSGLRVKFAPDGKILPS